MYIKLNTFRISHFPTSHV